MHDESFDRNEGYHMVVRLNNAAKVIGQDRHPVNHFPPSTHRMETPF